MRRRDRSKKPTCFKMASTVDPCSLSNSNEFKCRHISWQIDVDFPAKVLRCNASLKLECLKAGSEKLVSQSHASMMRDVWPSHLLRPTHSVYFELLAIKLWNLLGTNGWLNFRTSYSFSSLQQLRIKLLQEHLPCSWGFFHAELSYGIEQLMVPKVQSLISWFHVDQVDFRWVFFELLWHQMLSYYTFVTSRWWFALISTYKDVRQNFSF